MPNRKALLVLLSAVFLLLTLAGCGLVPKGSVVPTRAEVAGTWVHKENDSEIVLSKSGDVTFTNVPRTLLAGSDYSSGVPKKGEWGDLVTVSGTWAAPTSQGGAYPVIHYSTSNAANTLFYDSYTQSTTVLTLFYGDDLQYRYDFHRESRGSGSTS